MTGMVGMVGKLRGGEDRNDRGDRGDRGDIVMGWLTKLVVVLAVVAVLGFDAVQIGLTSVQLQDQANEAAAAARDAYAGHHDATEALAAAEQSARTANGDDVIVKGSFVVERDGSVSLQLTRPIHTIVAHYLPVTSFRTGTSGGSAAAATSG